MVFTEEAASKESPRGVCSQCCDFDDSHAEGKQDRLIKQVLTKTRLS